MPVAIGNVAIVLDEALRIDYRVYCFVLHCFSGTALNVTVRWRQRNCGLAASIGFPLVAIVG